MTINQQNFDAKVLHTALARMTTDRAIIKQAFNHWLQTLANQKFDVINTVTALEKYLGLSTQERKVLMVSLHAAANRAEQQLPPVPDYILANQDSTPSAPPPVVGTHINTSKPAVIELTEAYFDSLINGVQKINAKDFFELNKVLHDEGLINIPTNLNIAIRTTASDQIQLPSTSTEAECQSLCHELYLLVAEFIGPREADNLADSAITALLEMPAASHYDPRKLL